MRTVRFELLRPDEILAEKKRVPVIYQPIGPLEWHGPHLPYGTDALHAEAVARQVAEMVGGVVMPTLFWGTERERSPETLRHLGFRGDEYIVGMDSPYHSMKSLYSPEDVFGMVVRARLDLIVQQGYPLIVIINGHGASNHINTLNRLAVEYTGEKRAQVLYVIAFEPEADGQYYVGHAEALETSLMQSLYPDSVDISALPPLPTPLKNIEWGIVDGATFAGQPTPDFTLPSEHDPRVTASAEKGEQKMATTVRRIAAEVQAALQGLES
jgi:creatinine amidohydrolase